MSEITATARLRAVLRAPAERVYRAFLDPDAIPVELFYLGGEQSLAALAQVVQPDIPDGA